jgi:two-component system LytT family response regulator
MTKILIVNDNRAEGSKLESLIKKHVLAEKDTLFIDCPCKALNILSEFKPHLVMLNIEMRSMTGFDFLNLCAHRKFDVIFTAPSDAHAIKAIRYNVLDYLLQPIKITELQTAVNRHLVRKNCNTVHQPKPLEVEEGNVFKLVLSNSDGVFFYDPKKIIRLKAESNYTRFYFIDQKPMLVARTLKNYEEILLGHNFIRTHKSHMVNKRFVTHLGKGEFLWLADGSHISVSRRKKEELVKELIGN